MGPVGDFLESKLAAQNVMSVVMIAVGRERDTVTFSQMGSPC